MEEPEQQHDFSPPNTPPPHISISAPFSHSSRRRLSTTHFSSRGAVLAGRKLAWVSLQGRIVGAEEATSARSVGGGLRREEAVAWEMFSPMQRVLVVAVVAVAADGSRKDREVARLRRSVAIRDELLLCMQQKLDDLCENMNPMKEQFTSDGNFFSAAEKFICEERLKTEGPEFCCGGFNSFSLHTEAALASFDTNPSNGKKNIIGAESGRNEKFKTPQLSTIEQEERRMSDLSDIFSSATSSVDIQMSALAEEQDYYNVRRECEEKDATIKELTAAMLGSSVAESKRIAELEDIVKRRNLVITKLRKDLMFLEQQVIQLTRIRRPSFAASNSKVDKTQLPLMSNNILYDMSSSSPSSSDSDCPETTTNDHSQGDDAVSLQSLGLTENHMSSSSLPRSVNRPSMPKSSSLLKENRTTNISKSTTLFKPKQMVSSGVPRRTKRCDYLELESRDSQRRWV